MPAGASVIRGAPAGPTTHWWIHLAGQPQRWHTNLVSYTLRVNGREREVDVYPDTPLLWVLREELQLTGTRFGCGMALCGACTVHLDGQPVRSCVTSVESVGTQEVRTIEGLGGDHPVQKAWVAENVPQCGYCQSGQIMSATALLERNPEPSDEDIAAAMDGNLCRCGTYPRIRRAIARAAASLRASGEPSTETPSRTDGSS